MIKRIVYTLCFISFFCAENLYAQKEANNWVFGNNAGMTWNTTRSFTGTYVSGGSGAVVLTGMPTKITGSQMIADQGCFTLSDKNGNLMLYSNGQDLWNSSHQKINSIVMNGNLGNAQSGILVPYPGKANKYIAVTIGLWSLNTFSYTVIDMSGNGGAGVVESLNNSFPGGHVGGLGSSVTSIRHKNGSDYWIVAPGKIDGSQAYLNAWRVTSNGINTPVKSPLGVIVKATSTSTGCLKFSPDGKYFVWGTFVDRKLIFGEFNSETGQFSNIKYITSTKADGLNDFYGVEFSRSGKYLYVTETTNSRPTNYSLYAFDFKALFDSQNPQTYFQSAAVKKILFPSSTGGMPADLQLAPDGRMYIAGYPLLGSPNCLYVMLNPEEFNNLKIVRLDNFVDGQVRYGLPSFAASWFEIKLEGETEFCAGVDQEYTLEISRGEGSEDLHYIQWDFGDGSEPVKDYNITDGTIQSHSHTYSVGGNYVITATAHKADDTEITSIDHQVLNVTVLSVPTFTVSADDVCLGSSGTMISDNTDDTISINWYNNEDDETPFHTGNTCSTGEQHTAGTITFYVEAVNEEGCCSERTAVNVVVKSCGASFLPVNPHIRGFFNN